MKHLVTLILLFVVTVCMSAQSTFTDHLTKKVGGQGVVTLSQSKRLTDLVNGVAVLPVATSVPTTQTKVNDDTSEEPVVDASHYTKKIKARGYRIQVFWGGNKATDRSQAQSAGFKVTAQCPELQAYTSYESPHWRCRVGDFVTREEAAKYITKIRREIGISSAMIVKSEIWMYQ